MFLYECSFDITSIYCYKYEVVKETEKCYFIKSGRMLKNELDKVNIYIDRSGTSYGRISVVDEDIDNAVEKINKIKTEFLLRTTSNMVTRRDME